MLTREDTSHIPRFLYSKVSDKMVFIKEWVTYGKSIKFHSLWTPGVKEYVSYFISG